MTLLDSRRLECDVHHIPGGALPERRAVTDINDAFCLRLTVAVLYRAGLDAMDEQSSLAGEAREFLDSDFALLALQVLQSPGTRDIDWGDVSDYVGHIQRIHRKRYGTDLFPAKSTGDPD
jgi:hypothetical protein